SSQRRASISGVRSVEPSLTQITRCTYGLRRRFLNEPSRQGSSLYAGTITSTDPIFLLGPRREARQSIKTASRHMPRNRISIALEDYLVGHETFTGSLVNLVPAELGVARNLLRSHVASRGLAFVQLKCENFLLHE